MKPEDLAELSSAVSAMRALVERQGRIIDGLLAALVQHREEAPFLGGDGEVLQTITTMIHMCGISAHSILALTTGTQLQVQDAYPIARKVIEGCINVAFIMAEGADSASRAKRHAEAKAYRDFDRRLTIGGWKLQAGKNINLTPEQRACLDDLVLEFTSKKGFEKDWTDFSLRQRIDRIAASFSERAVLSLLTSYALVYRQASEVAHGSYFAALFFWGIEPGRNGPSSKQEAVALILNHQFAVLSAVIFAYCGLCETFSEYAEFAPVGAEAAEIMGKLRRIPLIAAALSNDNGVSRT